MLAAAGGNPFDWAQTGTLGGVLAFFVWAFFLKDPPLFISFRELRQTREDCTTRVSEKDHRIAELIEENRDVRGLGHSSVEATHTAVDIAERLQGVVRELREMRGPSP